MICTWTEYNIYDPYVLVKSHENITAFLSLCVFEMDQVAYIPHIFYYTYSKSGLRRHYK